MNVNLFKMLAISVAGAMLIPMGALADDTVGQEGKHPDGRGDVTLQSPRAASTFAVVTGNGIGYNGGPVMRDGVNIYYIWYGNWAHDQTASSILTDFASSIGGSPYFNINTTYGDGTGNVPNTAAAIKYAASAWDSGSLGTSLTDNGVWNIVVSAIEAGKLPLDPNGAYFVLTAPYVAETSGFLTKYCGWHTFGNYNNVPIKFAFIGNPAANMSACAAQSVSPNGDAEADAMVSSLAHELEEQATDPLLNAWYDASGEENADKCAWTFGNLYKTSNGSYANMKLGLRDYLIQQNWVNAGGGYCAQSYGGGGGGGTPDFSLSVSPASQTVTAGGSTGAYTVTETPINSYSGTVTYSVTNGVPPGASAMVNGNRITIATSTGTPVGTYTFTIQGTDGSITHTVTASLSVTGSTAAPIITVSPAFQSVTRPPLGGTPITATYAVSLSGFAGTVYLYTSGTSPGITLSLNPSTMIGNGVTTLTAIVTPSAYKGSWSFIVYGYSTTGQVKQAAVGLQIN